MWEIAAVEGTREGEPVVEPLFRFRPRAGEGTFEATGYVPTMVHTLRARGESLPDALFDVGVDR